jgi:dTMP kinase
MATNNRRGRYIVWEGSDGVGKGTQIDFALEESAARDIPTLRVREPGGTELGETLRGLILHGEDLDAETELAMLIAQRSHLARRKILPALEEGIDVHSDRNFWSGVYQAAHETMTLEEIIRIHRMFMPEWYMQPDIGIIIQLPTAERIRRKLAAAASAGIQLDRMEQKDADFFARVDEGYSRGARLFGAHVISGIGSKLDVKAKWMPLLFQDP